MAKPKVNAPVIQEAVKTFAKDKFLPIYFFYGADTYNIEIISRQLEAAVSPFIGSDFDKETVYGENSSVSEIISLASSFPFGSEKKLIIVKEFDKLKDKKTLAPYIDSPSPFTILLLLGSSESNVSESEPFKSLINNGFIYEAKELKGAMLVNWLVMIAEKNGKTLTKENAQFLMDISGERRDLLEDQLEKIFIFLGDKKEIDLNAIRDMSASLKEFTIFELQNSLGKKEAGTAVKVAYNLLDNGMDITQILFMLTRYFTGLSRMKELTDTNTNENVAARIVGTNYFYYKDYIAARKLYSDADLLKAVRALINADLMVKTSAADPKTIITMLISEILSR